MTFLAALAALCAGSAPAQVEDLSAIRNLTAARLGETVEVSTGYHGSEVYGAVMLSVTDPANPFPWNTPLIADESRGWPPWVGVHRGMGTRSKSARVGVPLLNLSTVKWRMHLIRPEDCVPTSTRHLRLTARVGVGPSGAAGEFTVIFNAYVNWFVTVDPGDVLMLPGLSRNEEVLHLRVRLGINYEEWDPVDPQLMREWPDWAECRLRGADHLLRTNGERTRKAGNVFILAYERSPLITGKTRLESPVFLDVVVNERIPAWAGRVLASHQFPEIMDPLGVAGSEKPPTDTPGPSYVITPTYTVTHTATLTPTFTPQPPTETPTLTPTRSGPEPTLARMRPRRNVELSLDGRELNPEAPLVLDSRRRRGGVLEITYPADVVREDNPLTIAEAPAWLARPELEYDAAHPRVVRLRLEPALDAAFLATLSAGQTSLEGWLSIAPRSADVPVLPMDIGLRLTDLDWRLALDPSRVDFSTDPARSRSVRLGLSCGDVPVPIPPGAILRTRADPKNAWADQCVSAQAAAPDPAAAAPMQVTAAVRLDPAAWHRASRTALLSIDLVADGRVAASGFLSVSYRPPAAEGESLLPVSPAAIAGIGGGALLLLLAAFMLARRRHPAPAETSLRRAGAAVAEPGEEPFADLPPEEEDQLPVSPVAGGPVAPLPTGPVAPWQGGEEEPFPAVAAAVRDTGWSAGGLKQQIRLALEYLEPAGGDETVAPTPENLDRIAEELYARMRPLVDRVERMEDAVERGAGAGGVAPLLGPMEDAGDLRDELQRLKAGLRDVTERVERVETRLEQGSALSGDEAAQIKRDASAARELINSFESRVSSVLQVCQPMQVVWEDLNALRGQLSELYQGGRPPEAGRTPAPSEDLTEQVAQLSEDVQNHFRQQIRFQGRLVLGSLPRELGPREAVLQLDRFTSRPRLAEMQQGVGARVEVGTAVMHVLAEMVLTGDSPNAMRFRQAWNEVRGSGYAEAARQRKPDEFSDPARRLQTVIRQLRQVLEAHHPEPRQELSDDWLAGEALRLLAATLEGWLK